MNRRRFSVGLGAMLLFASPAIRAQRPKPRIALPLPGASGPLSAKLIGALKDGMREQGYPDDHIEYDVLHADGQISRQERIVAELVARNPDAIVVISPPFVRAALKVTRTIPVVMANVSDPVGNRFINSLARPGGNVTGIATLYETILPKLAELLHELVPAATRVAVLLNENNPSTAAFWQSAEPALRALGKTPIRLNASSEAQIVDAFDRMKTSGVQAAIIVTDNTFVQFRDRIAALAQAAGIPSVYGIREHVVAGGLASYGPSIVGNYRASARYVAKILKGARAADLPVEQPTRFETVINRKTADALRIRIPTAVLLRADEVIE
ncbi:MAG: ABC transporter substrate-binding protein [Betaproteobacteria bacterium]|nr:MAG: ABC transporter substrate-binding protein [Betaproteobacteria bacterium]